MKTRETGETQKKSTGTICFLKAINLATRNNSVCFWR